jgi:hypothetical protein
MVKNIIFYRNKKLGGLFNNPEHTILSFQKTSGGLYFQKHATLPSFLSEPMVKNEI